jgi:hypothetical protein
LFHGWVELRTKTASDLPRGLVIQAYWNGAATWGRGAHHEIVRGWGSDDWAAKLKQSDDKLQEKAVPEVAPLSPAPVDVMTKKRP